jgi:diguanylate cyclase (GGDEF)-like protein
LAHIRDGTVTGSLQGGEPALVKMEPMARQLVKESSPILTPKMQASTARGATGLNNPKLMGRATMIMFFMGGTCGLVTLVTTHDPNLNLGVGWTVTAAAYLMVILLWWGGGVIPEWAPPIAAAVGTVMVSVAISVGGSTGGAVFPLIYIWGALYSFTFFTRRVAIFQICWIAIGFITASYISGHVPPAYVITVLFTIVAQAPFVRFLVSEIVELGRVDPLTGVANRRAFDEQMEYVRRDVQRSHRSNAVIMLDIDYFKQYNDNRGHLDGDQFLRDATTAWKEVLRGSDLLARFGGEEFVVLLRDCGMEGALECADRIRSVVPGAMTCSAGVAAFQPGETSSTLMARVDLALYRAKTEGRNRTIRADEVLPPDVAVMAKSERAVPKLA